MSIDDARDTRLQFLTRVASRESRLLRLSDERVFSTAFTAERSRSMDRDTELAEGARFTTMPCAETKTSAPPRAT